MPKVINTSKGIIGYDNMQLIPLVETEVSADFLNIARVRKLIEKGSIIVVEDAVPTNTAKTKAATTPKE